MVVGLKRLARRGAHSESSFQRPGEFLDREKELATLEAELRHQCQTPKVLRVCEITGVGGMGKSRLMDEMRALSKKRPLRIDRLAFVSLEGDLSGTEVGVLYRLRREVGIECHLFDAALQRYWRAVGQPVPPESPNRIERSILRQGAELGAVLGGVPLPINFAVQVWGKISRHGEKQQRYEKSEFTAIDEMREEPRELRAILPSCLAKDIKWALAERGGQSLAIFYDSYEKQRNPQEGAPWLQEMISTLGRGLHVVASREPLGWPKAKWELHTAAVSVEELPEKEAREMLRQRLGKLEDPVEERLLAISRRTPFYIESAVRLYLDLAEEKEVEAADLPSTPDGAVTRLLDHRRAPQRALASALATGRIFDRDLYQHMADVLNVELAVLHYQDFTDSFLTESVSGELYKFHDLLTDAVRESPAEKALRRVALEAAADHLWARSQERGRTEPETVLALLRGLLEGWLSVSEVPRRSIEALIDIGYVLYDAGFSNELMALASTQARKQRHSITLVLDYLEAMSARRIDGVEAGIRRFERLRSRKRRLGRHLHSLELELAYLRELRGNYRRARGDFLRLARQAEPFDPTDRTQLRALLYHGDVLTMDGRFREGSRVLQETYEAVGHRDIVNWGELVRHRAHAYRFSFLLEEAAELYQLALRKTPDAPVLTAKLYTNLVETYCWFEPDLALKEAVKSIEMNERIGHQIELAKCAAAKGIALARLGKRPDAAAAIDEAKALAKATGYPAGSGFALQAEAIAMALAEDTRARNRAIGGLRRKTKELGTYSHLTAAPLVAAGEDVGSAAIRKAAEWFEPDDVGTRIRTYLGL
jgi:tetratricopeptide (TPR) repeat protein